MTKSHSSLPYGVEEYIMSLPPASQNNSRAIVRSTCERILAKHHPFTAANILNAKFGFGLDPDYDPRVDEDRGDNKQQDA